MLNKYKIEYGGELLAITYSYNKAIYHANNVLSIVKNNPVDGEDYRLLHITKYSILDRIINYFNKKNKMFFIPNCTIIYWSEKDKEFKIIKK